MSLTVAYTFYHRKTPHSSAVQFTLSITKHLFADNACGLFDHGLDVEINQKGGSMEKSQRTFLLED